MLTDNRGASLIECTFIKCPRMLIATLLLKFWGNESC